MKTDIFMKLKVLKNVWMGECISNKTLTYYQINTLTHSQRFRSISSNSKSLCTKTSRAFEPL